MEDRGVKRQDDGGEWDGKREKTEEWRDKNMEEREVVREKRKKRGVE